MYVLDMERREMNKYKGPPKEKQTRDSETGDIHRINTNYLLWQ